MSNKQTMKEAGYKYIRNLGNCRHLLLHTSTNKEEVFFANKNHASWGIKFLNTHLEFVSGYKATALREVV